MMRPIAVAAALLFSTPNLVFAQSQAASSMEEKEPAINKVIQDWSNAHNSADIDAMVQLFHPQDRAVAREFYKDLKRGTATMRLTAVRPLNQDRLAAVTERSWGGSNPGKAPMTFHMSQFQGEWYLRIPGGSLTPSAAVIQRAKQEQPPASTPPAVVAVAPRAEPTPAPAPAKGEPAAKLDPKQPEPPKAAAEKAASEKAAPPPVRTTYDNWVRVCPTAKSPKKECFIEAVLANSADKKPILRWRLIRNEDGSASSVVVTPSAVTVAAGFELGLAKDKPTAIPFRVCAPQACELRFNMEPTLVETVSGKTVVPAKYINADGATVQFDIPMKGFKQAINSLKGR